MMTCTLWKQLQQLPEGPGCAGGDSPRENSSIRYALTCNRGLLARQSRIVFNTRPFSAVFFYSSKGQWNSSAECITINTTVWSFFFVLNEFAIEFFPVHLYLTHDFVNIYFYEIHFRWWLPDYSEKKNYRYHFKFRSIFSFILRIYFFK